MNQPQNNHDYQTFRSYFSKEEALPMVQFCEEKHIPYKLERNQKIIDSFIVGSSLQPEWALRVPTKYFSQANDLLQQSVNNITDIPASHYIHQFTIQELQDIAQNPEEWNEQDVRFARLLLEQKDGEEALEQVDLTIIQKQEELKEGKEGTPLWMYTYLVLSVFGAVLMTPLFFVVGLAMGWYYWKDQTLDKQGEQFHTFTTKTRRFGQVTFWIGSTMLALSLILWFFYGFWGVSDWIDLFAETINSPAREVVDSFGGVVLS